MQAKCVVHQANSDQNWYSLFDNLLVVGGGYQSRGFEVHEFLPVLDSEFNPGFKVVIL
jgi:hypothetical protein